MKLPRLLVLCLPFWVATVSGDSCWGGQLRAGAATSNITPELGRDIIGGFVPFPSRHVHDELHARCLVLDDGHTRLALVVCDLLGIDRIVSQQARQQIHQRYEIPPEHVLICATHTHSATSALGEDTRALNQQPDTYQQFVISRIVDGVSRANHLLRPAEIAFGTVLAPEHVFNRRWHMRPGSVPTNPFGGTDMVKMNPPRGSPNLVEPAGPTDPSVSFFSIRQLNGRPLAIFAAYSLHYVGGVGKGDISADYFAVFSEHLKELVMSDQAGDDAGPPFVAMMANGTSGDINNIDFQRPRPARKPYEQMNHVGRDLAVKVSAARQSIQYRNNISLAAVYREPTVAWRRPTAAERAWAEQTIAAGRKADRDLSYIYAQRTMRLAEYPETTTVPLQLLRIGDVLRGDDAFRDLLRNRTRVQIVVSHSACLHGGTCARILWVLADTSATPIGRLRNVAGHKPCGAHGVGKAAQGVDRDGRRAGAGMTLARETIARIRDSVRPDRLLDTAVQLIEVPSPTGSANAVADRLQQILDGDGFPVQRVEAGWPDAPAVVARLDSGVVGRTLQLNGHLDTVHLPFVPPRVENGVLHGSGSSDMKGGIAASVEAMRALRDADALKGGTVMLTAHDLHEAPWGDGRQVSHLIAEGYVGDGVLLPEYLADRIPVVGRGLAVLAVEVKRPGYPVHEVLGGIEQPSVIQCGAEIVHRFHESDVQLARRTHPMAGRESLFVGQIHSGEIYNQAPTKLELSGTRRWLPGSKVDQVESEFHELLSRVAERYGVEVEGQFQLARDAFEISEDDALVQSVQSSCLAVSGARLPIGAKPFVDDGNTFVSQGGVPAVTHGPDALGAHTLNEEVQVSELVRVAQVYALTAIQFCP